MILFRFCVNDSLEIIGCQCVFTEIGFNAYYWYKPDKGLIFTQRKNIYTTINPEFKPTGTSDNRRKDFRREIVLSYQFQAALKTAIMNGYEPDDRTSAQIIANVPPVYLMEFCKMLGGYENDK